MVGSKIIYRTFMEHPTKISVFYKVFDRDVYSCRLSRFVSDYRKNLRPLVAYRLPQRLNLTAACRLPQLSAGFNGFPWISLNFRAVHMFDRFYFFGGW